MAVNGIGFFCFSSTRPINNNQVIFELGKFKNQFSVIYLLRFVVASCEINYLLSSACGLLFPHKMWN